MREYDQVMQSREELRLELGMSQARELGIELARLHGGVVRVGVSMSPHPLRARGLWAIVRRTVPTTRWWWWLLLLIAISNAYFAIQDFMALASLGNALFFLWLTVAILLESVLRKRRRQTALLLDGHLQEAMNSHLQAEAVKRQRNFRRAEKRKESRRARLIEEQRQRHQERRDEAVRSGIPPELVDPPGPRPGYVSPRDAEFLAAQWVRALGEPSARVTSFVSDGGVDVESDNYLAQVKHYQGKVGPASIRELVGVSKVDGRKPLFFTAGSYTASAIEFANSSVVPLFIYNTSEGTLMSANSHAEEILNYGL